MSGVPKKVLLGISGGIAAYKTPELVRALVRDGCEVEIILTEMAARLVSSLSLSTLSKRRAWRDADLASDELGWTIPHISLSGWADAFVVAPCTANVLRMAAQGDSSTLLGATMLAYDRPILFFPAMNSHMLANPATAENCRVLAERGHVVVDPDAGPLACGYEGKGRLPSTEAIMDEVRAMLCPEKDFADKKILVTAGPTVEAIDPVRFISNPSTGRMGYALAAAARYRGAEVVLVSGPSNERAPSGVRVVHVKSAEEMLSACLAELPDADAVIKAAAVGDYRAKDYAPQKIKREGAETMILELVQNPDIAREIGARKRDAQILVGFAAETENVEANARAKIARKGLDMVVANDVSAPGSGFGGDTNSVTVYFADRYGRTASPAISGSKLEVASGILDILRAFLR